MSADDKADNRVRVVDLCRIDYPVSGFFPKPSWKDSG